MIGRRVRCSAYESAHRRGPAAASRMSSSARMTSTTAFGPHDHRRHRHPPGLAHLGGMIPTKPRSGAEVGPRSPARARPPRCFRRTGIQATGVNAIIEVRGVAKATFYRHFPSKDDLVVAWLRDPPAGAGSSAPAHRRRRRVRGRAMRSCCSSRRPRSGWRPRVWGCPYLNTAVRSRTRRIRPDWSSASISTRSAPISGGLLEDAGYPDAERARDGAARAACRRHLARRRPADQRVRDHGEGGGAKAPRATLRPATG